MGAGMPVDPDALARAEAALANLGREYLAWVEADVGRLRQAISANDWQALHMIAHNAKGQAATFGYPLVTVLGARLCGLILEHPEPSREQWRLAERLVEGIDRVVGQRLAGDGGEAGAKLLADLG